jgi:hypothetical protein
LPQSPTLARKLSRTHIWSKPCHCSWLGCSQTSACEWTLQIFWWVIWMFHAWCWELCFAAGSGSWFMNLIICEAQLFAVWWWSHLHSLGISHKSSFRLYVCLCNCFGGCQIVCMLLLLWAVMDVLCTCLRYWSSI